MAELPKTLFGLRQIVAEILEDARYLTMSDDERLSAGLPVSFEAMRRFILLHRKDYTDASK